MHSAAYSSREAVTDDAKISVCVSELVSCRAENWLLKKKLHDYEVTIENLEQLMSTIMGKQHKILGEMSQLRKRNRELQIECNLQREYHSMERNALVKELHDVKTLSRERLFEMVKDGECELQYFNQFFIFQAENEPDELPDTDDSLDEYIMRKNSEDTENEDEQASSPVSTAASSLDTTPYTTEASDDDDDSLESEEEEDDQEDFSAVTDSDSD